MPWNKTGSENWSLPLTTAKRKIIKQDALHVKKSHLIAFFFLFKHAEIVFESAYHLGISRISSYQVNIEGFQLSWLGQTSEELGEGRGRYWVTQTYC